MIKAYGLTYLTRPVGMQGEADPYKHALPDTSVNMTNLIVLRQTVRAYVHRKKWPSCLLTSINVLETQTGPSATCDFLLVIRVNSGLDSYHVLDKGRFRSKLANFSNLRGFRLNFVTALGLKKLVSCAYRRVRMFQNIFIRLGAMSQRDGQTDRRTDRDGK